MPEWRRRESNILASRCLPPYAEVYTSATGSIVDAIRPFHSKPLQGGQALPSTRREIPRKLGFSFPKYNRSRLPSGGAHQFPGGSLPAGVQRLSRRTFSPVIQSVVLCVYIVTDRRPDQFVSTKGTEVYLNTSFSDWYVPIFLVHEKETGSPFVCHPHDPKAALRVEELFQFATAIVHVNHSECYRDITKTDLC
jgi:hypothetical protein